MIQHLC